MSTQINSLFDYQVQASKKNNAQKNGQETQDPAAAFAAFMAQNTQSHSVFKGSALNLDVPQPSRTSAEKFAAMDRTQDRDTLRNETPPEPTKPTRDDTPPRERSTEANTAVDGRQRSQETTQNHRPDQPSGRPNAADAAKDHANANSAVQKQNANQATQADQAQAAAAAKVSAKAEQQATGQQTATANATAGSNDNTIKASVTTQSSAVGSQPTSKLAAESSVMADASTEGSSAVVAKGAAQNGHNGGNGTNGQHQGQNNTNANGQTANANIVQSQAAGATSTAQQQQQATGSASFNNALAAAQTSAGGKEAAVANLGGSSGQIASADPLTGATAVQGQNGSIQRGSTPVASHARRPQVPAQVVADQVAVNIQRAAGQGNDRINIQLRPLELGKIEVKMELGHDGRMHATISAEKPETLDMLRNDARNLIQTLNDAGLQTDANSLNFNLQGQDGSNQQQTAQGDAGGSGGQGEDFSLDGDAPVLDDSPLLGDGEDVVLDQDGRLNVRV